MEHSGRIQHKPRLLLRRYDSLYECGDSFYSVCISTFCLRSHEKGRMALASLLFVFDHMKKAEWLNNTDRNIIEAALVQHSNRIVSDVHYLGIFPGPLFFTMRKKESSTLAGLLSRSLTMTLFFRTVVRRCDCSRTTKAIDMHFWRSSCASQFSLMLHFRH